jgi:alkanesulfonate monooxygenase SsuD/methylene tetrahydromethanopterin reductase-like flavin-dependent oxidoreductase (luciferase family)
MNLPLRLPSMIAKSAASLDLLSGGRVELGLGAGTFWEAVEAMGGPRRTPKESVDALEEAIAVVRAFWSDEQSATARRREARPAARSPDRAVDRSVRTADAAAHRPARRRLAAELRWTVFERRGRPADAVADRRGGETCWSGSGIGEARRERARARGSPDGWTDQLLRAGELGFETLLVGVPDDDPVGFIRRLGEEIAPRVRVADDSRGRAES